MVKVFLEVWDRSEARGAHRLWLGCVGVGGCMRGKVWRTQEHILQEMASKFGALAGAAVAAVGALCSYEARVLHLHSSPGESFQVPFALLALVSPVFQPVEREREREERGGGVLGNNGRASLLNSRVGFASELMPPLSFGRSWVRFWCQVELPFVGYEWWDVWSVHAFDLDCVDRGHIPRGLGFGVCATAWWVSDVWYRMCAANYG